ncbi:large subunit GTPase 1 homolog [Sitodiplosis mosellana]|uniref:large subunit GTPase 1 homolog n=1 Tax=Sitodiplosis mosellana TaxID=263140 RepID=UPI00244534F8|nr:large subunit GTPase 1 homolog [Sitodiplosis mosellana]
MGKKSKGGNLGRALIRDRFGQGHRRTVDNNSMLHTTEIQDGYDWGRLNLQSVTEESSFQEFLRTAELAGTEFQAEKLNIQFVNPKSNVGILSKTEREAAEKKHTDKKGLLKIPRRPTWTPETTADDLHTQENLSFLEWRRGLAMLQEEEGILMTPYEKNLEFWRQLWRVVERSDVIVQIVDARNPLLFRSEDLEKYVKEVSQDKMNMILINKADFLTDEQRVTWANYFDNENMKVAFYSATLVTEENNKSLEDITEETDNKSEDNSEEEDEGSDGKEASSDEKQISVDSIKKATDEIAKSVHRAEEQLEIIEKKLGVHHLNDPKILSRSELIELFRNVHKGPKVTDDISTIGLVGYPNVGKSSTINSLMIEKKVSVSATPGKTKHFQTLYLDTDILLCDCPGLVMPSFVLTKAEMILNGILPIDQMRDHVPAVNILCSQIPRHTLEDKYGIIIAKPQEGEDSNRPPYSEELLLAYGYNRGFMTARGQPDQSRSARYVLKDYVNGRLLYCHAPPGYKQKDFHKYAPRIRLEKSEDQLTSQQQRAMRIDRSKTTKDIDKNFFEPAARIAYIKGKTNLAHIRGLAKENETASTGSTSVGGSMQSLNSVHLVEKPWRHQKKEKREKLRKKFAHLDQH